MMDQNDKRYRIRTGHQQACRNWLSELRDMEKGIDERLSRSLADEMLSGIAHPLTKAEYEKALFDVRGAIFHLERVIVSLDMLNMRDYPDAEF